MDIDEFIEIMEEKGYKEIKEDMYLKEVGDETRFVDMRNDRFAIYSYKHGESKKVSSEQKRLKMLYSATDEEQATLEV